MPTIHVHQARLHEYTCPLVSPVTWAGTTYHRRRVLVIEIQDENGRWGRGEAAPLPGFSSERFEDAHQVLQEAISILPGEDVPLPTPLPFDWPASARFAVESALLDLVAQLYDVTRGHVLQWVAWDFFGQSEVLPPTDAVSTACLIAAAPETWIEETARAVQAGFDTVKLKVARWGEAEEEARAITELADRFPSLTFRLDANRGWSIQEALVFARHIPSKRIAFIEEPLRDASQLSLLAHQTSLPIALDETFQVYRMGAYNYLADPAALILKPSLLGSPTELLRIAADARMRGATPIISSSYECGPGMQTLIEMASLPLLCGAAAGLDTARAFETMVAPASPSWIQSSISLRDIRPHVSSHQSAVEERIEPPPSS